ncbi:MAG: hypothetical protein ABSD74_20775, partial [Rhizomicrobium sp.]
AIDEQTARPCDNERNVVQSCPSDLASRLADESRRSETLRSNMNLAGLDRDDRLVEGWARATALSGRMSISPSAKPVPSQEEVWRSLAGQYRDLPLGALRNATSSLDEQAGGRPSNPSDERLKSMVELGLDILTELSPIKFELPVAAHAGAISQELVGDVTDSVKSSFTDLIRDTIVAVLPACSRGPARCDSKLREQLKTAEHDPRAVAYGARLAPIFTKAIANWNDTYRAVRIANDSVDNLLHRKTAPSLEFEKRSPWQRVMDRWQMKVDKEGDSKAPDIKDTFAGMDAIQTAFLRLRISLLLASWRDESYRLALGASRVNDNSPSGGWDMALFRYMSKSADDASLFSFMLMQDREAKTRLLGSNPGAQAAGYADIFRSFARSIAGDTADTRRLEQIADTPEFAGAARDNLPPLAAGFAACRGRPGEWASNRPHSNGKATGIPVRTGTPGT